MYMAMRKLYSIFIAATHCRRKCCDAYDVLGRQQQATTLHTWLWRRRSVACYIINATTTCVIQLQFEQHYCDAWVTDVLLLMWSEQNTYRDNPAAIVMWPVNPTHRYHQTPLYLWHIWCLFCPNHNRIDYVAITTCTREMLIVIDLNFDMIKIALCHFFHLFHNFQSTESNKNIFLRHNNDVTNEYQRFEKTITNEQVNLRLSIPPQFVHW